MSTRKQLIYSTCAHTIATNLRSAKARSQTSSKHIELPNAIAKVTLDATNIETGKYLRHPTIAVPWRLRVVAIDPAVNGESSRVPHPDNSKDADEDV